MIQSALGLPILLLGVIPPLLRVTWTREVSEAYKGMKGGDQLLQKLRSLRNRRFFLLLLGLCGSVARLGPEGSGLGGLVQGYGFGLRDA